MNQETTPQSPAEYGVVVAKLLLDPTSERIVIERVRLDRPTTLTGKVVGLLDISKPRGDLFLDRLEQRLTAMGATVRRYRKPTFAKPAPVDLRQQITAQCHLVIEALAD
jgi:hypothetical protein